LTASLEKIRHRAEPFGVRAENVGKTVPTDRHHKTELDIHRYICSGWFGCH
jgi:hypothetical protein